ncbi:MAG: hypothetical protein HQL88_01685 [Magnetococcales bacterium]|nr:hypothetical protein [Magnetococcales bacterium]
MKYRLLLLLTILSCAASASADVGKVNPAATQSQKLPIRVGELAKAPAVDGDLADWPGLEHPIWHSVPMQPAILDDPGNQTGQLKLLLAVGLTADRIFVAARWPDATQDNQYKPWQWQQDKYEQSKKLDDMLAIRFHLTGPYDVCMLPEREGSYQVDVWQWSAGRSNLAGLAEDMVHTISTRFVEDAAEYPLPNGHTVYIKKRRDDGAAFYKVARPDKKFQGETLPGVVMTGSGSGSLVDVAAVGRWQEGHWSLEMSRLRVTGHDDDVAFPPGASIPGGIAVFNKGNAEHKSVEGNLLFELSDGKK